MHKVLILGAGKIGSLISGLLAESGDYAVHVADVERQWPRPRSSRRHGQLDHLHALRSRRHATRPR